LPQDEAVIAVVVHEANYAWDEELRTAAKRGLTFVGWHECGSEYPAGRFAGVDGKYAEVETDNGGEVVVRLTTNYKPIGIPALKRAEKHIAEAEKRLQSARAGAQPEKKKKTPTRKVRKG
jgi:hypothetical protein